MLASYMKARKTPFHRGVRIEYFSPHVHLYGNIEFSRRRIQGILTDRIATDTQWHQGRRTGRQLSSQFNKHQTNAPSVLRFVADPQTTGR